MKKKTKGKSLRFRINLWYTILMCVMSVALIGSVAGAARVSEKSEAQQNLIRGVERNIDEIEVENGVLDIESDFAYTNGNVHMLIFGSDGRLLAGEYPDGITLDEPLQKGASRTVNDYYIYDSYLEFFKYEYKIHGSTGAVISEECDGLDSYTPYEGDLDQKGEGCSLTFRQAAETAIESSGVNPETAELIFVKAYDYNEDPLYEIEFYSPEKGHEDVWVRGVARADDFSGTHSTLVKIAGALIPLLVIFGAAIGSFISAKAMLPVKKLSETIAETRSGNDLTKRIEVADSDPALVNLAENFNSMFERLEKSFEGERQFTSDVSHELRTPLSVILAECEYQLSRGDLTQEDREGFETIKKQGDSMKQIVSQLLYFSRMEQGREKPEFRIESFSELVEGICVDMSAVTEKNITIETDIDGSIEMKLDISMMTRLVTNLVLNGIIYGKENGKVWVSLKKENGKVLLRVRDNGIGIAKENLDKIWQRFYRADKSRSREKGCSGLGLPMVKQIALLHGGSVSVESEENRGSTFTAEFPLE